MTIKRTKRLKAWSARKNYGDDEPLVNDAEYRSILDAWPDEPKAARAYWNSLPIEQMLEHFTIFEVDRDGKSFAVASDLLIRKVLKEKREAKEFYVRVSDMDDLRTMVPRIYNALCKMFDSDGDVEMLRLAINAEVGGKTDPSRLTNEVLPYDYEELKSMPRQALVDIAVNGWNMDLNLISGSTNRPKDHQLVRAIWRAQSDEAYVQRMQAVGEDDEDEVEDENVDEWFDEERRDRTSLRRLSRQELIDRITAHGMALRAGVAYTDDMLVDILMGYEEIEDQNHEGEDEDEWLI